MKFMTLTFLLASVLTTLAIGCSRGEVDNDFQVVTVGPGDERVTIDDGVITNIIYFSNWIVMGSRFEIRIYEAKKPNNLLALFNGHPGIVEDLVLTQENSIPFITAGCSDGTIRCWDTEKVREVIEDEGKNGILVFTELSKDYYRDINGKEISGVKSLASLSATEELFASAHEDSHVRLWRDLDPETQSFKLTGHVGRVNVVTFSHDKSYLASGGVDKKIRVWDLNSKTYDDIFDKHDGEITTLAFSPDKEFFDREGTFLASGGKDSKVIVWKLNTSGSEETDKVHTFQSNQEVTALVFVATHKLLVAGTKKGDILAWDTTDVKSEVKLLEQYGSAVTALVSSSDGKMLVSGHANGLYHIFPPE